MLSRYDREKTFFYLDPPYFRAPYYNYNMELPDFQELAQVMINVKGKFILSINDLPEMRDVFKAFNIKPVIVKYTCNGKIHQEGKELLVSNF